MQQVGEMQSTAPISFHLDNGFPNNAKITITLGEGAMFSKVQTLYVCV